MLARLRQLIQEKLLPPDERALRLLEIRPWYPVRLVALYRLFIAVLLNSVFFTGLGSSSLGSANEQIFALAAMLYLGLSLLWITLIHLRAPSYGKQVYLQISSDIVLTIILMQTSGGLSSGLGILLVVIIGSSTLIINGVAGLLFAAITTLLIFSEQLYTHLTHGITIHTYPQIGALGAALFGISLIMLILKRRVQESERLAEQRELDIENLAELNEQIIQHIQSGVIVVDSDAQIRLINRAAKMQLGVTNIDAPSPLDKLSDELASRFGLWQAAAQEASNRIRFPGSPFELQPHFTSLGPDGEAGTLVVLEDTTPYSREFQSIKLASLGRLTASIAHEIRNPLSAIQHAAQLLSESEDSNKEDQRLTEIIHKQTQRVNAIIESVLQLSTKEKTMPTPIDLAHWVEDFMIEFQDQHPDCKITTRNYAPECSVFFDPSQLHQIAWNLCSNSLKYGQDSHGRVSIDLNSGIDLDQSHIYLEIADYGSGISQEKQDQAFEPFYTTGGNSPGLGLYIVRELCEFNHAQIQYVDKPGYGAVFRILFSQPLNPKQ